MEDTKTNIINTFKNLTNEDKKNFLSEIAEDEEICKIMRSVTASSYKKYRAEYYKNRYKNDEEFRNKMKKKSNENYHKRKEEKKN